MLRRVSPISTGLLRRVSTSSAGGYVCASHASDKLANQLIQATSGFDGLHVFVAPPRTASTPFARVFWESPAFQFYSHEPFESVYYQGKSTDVALKCIGEGAADITDSKKKAGDSGGKAIIVKEMTFQVAEHFGALLASLQGKPIMFLMRHPLEAVESRLRMKRVGGEPDWGKNDDFPANELGFLDLVHQVEHCEYVGYPYHIVDVEDCLKDPEGMFAQVFAAWDLKWDKSYLEWKDATELLVKFDNLSEDGSKHSHLYVDVLKSTSFGDPKGVVEGSTTEAQIESGGSETEHQVGVDAMPDPVRKHLEWSLQKYDELRNNPNLIHPTRERDTFR